MLKRLYYKIISDIVLFNITETGCFVTNKTLDKLSYITSTCALKAKTASIISGNLFACV